jgi:hypothetical protein
VACKGLMFNYLTLDEIRFQSFEILASNGSQLLSKDTWFHICSPFALVNRISLLFYQKLNPDGTLSVQVKC